MARQLRIQYPGAYYHVTCRGNERKDIYREEEDYCIFLEKLSDSLDVYKVLLLSYVCMTNHFHLLLTTPLGNISVFYASFQYFLHVGFQLQVSEGWSFISGEVQVLSG